MKLTLKIAKVLVQLINGESIPNHSAKSRLIDDLVSENIITRKGKHKKSLDLINKTDLHTYLANQLQVNDLNKYVLALENENSTRAELVKITTDSKKSKERAFKGFLLNSYSSIKAELNNATIIINPTKGSFVFIYDYESFKIPKEITVIGVENAKNFSQIQEQKYLFKNINPLFVSRYPQNQNKDFIKWMNSIPNNYMHFGDFDIAGIGIYLNEYKKHLLRKATFFIPENIKSDLRNNGNRERFDNQKMNFKIESIQESKILELIEIIKLEKKGLDQEYYIETDSQR
ncbi:hypothetical protein APS56_15965 [Pseudalgibacter alginicilyticus]|uniref:DUF7281 domain-containing protein n=1 Tax=Pseudalgibacter alginicilyticus TaxID=1736674 RepID=A0A0P0DC51_9FLAO|nr:hypothetical protein [Pseudalgibacter alginicilyticus]ALJ06538.1 hypothetical protein APS56_15965 [Pseudalgibacter alginicilyticus]